MSLVPIRSYRLVPGRLTPGPGAAAASAARRDGARPEVLALRRDRAARREVESLLSHHDPVSLFDKPVGRAPDPPARTLAPESTASGRWHLGTARRAAWVLAAAGALLGLGLWTHSRIEHALLQHHAIELETVLHAKVEALGVWIREQEGQLRLLAADPHVLDAARELLEAGRGRTRAAATESWKQAPARQRLNQLGELFADKTHGRRWIGLADDRGVIVFSPAETEIGRLVNTEGRRYLSRALEGETVFARPYRMGDLIGDYTTGTMYTWVLTPLRGASGEASGVLTAPQTSYGPSSISGVLATGEYTSTLGRSLIFP
jgi:hypothetical protein